MWLMLGSPSQISALTISGYAVIPSTIGQLNSLIGTCYMGTGHSGAGVPNYDVVPPYTPQELSVVGQMYLISYYSNLATSTMGFGGDGVGGLPFTTLNEGDTKLGRANPAAIGAVYLGQVKEATADLRYLVNAYINNVQGGNTPRAVNYLGLLYPEWGSSYNGWGP